MRFTSYTLLASTFLFWSPVSSQLTGAVGPITSLTTKTAKKTCNVLSYGAKADGTTDIGLPLTSAFAACKTGGVVVIPPGNYALATWITLSGGTAWALQLDGIITRTGTAGGNMIFIEHGSDFELFSSTGKGAVQGNGYIFHQTGSLTGPRILRFYEMDRFSVHDLILVDSPSFHFSMDTCTNGEVYNMAIRGGDHGGLDGIDVWSDNMWIHDIMVTNKDECVTVKSPAHNIVVENIYCNWSGGCAMGSLGAGVDVSDITYRNVYTWSSNQMYMVKSNGGSGTVSNVLFENFIGHGNAYSLDIDSYWASIGTTAGAGVQLNNVTFNKWHGTEASGTARGPIKVLCADGAPCTNLTISDFAMWTESGSSQWYSCRSAYGSGFCLRESGSSRYAVSTTTVSAAPSGYSAATMPYDLKSGPGFTVSIPIPTMPASFFPGIAPINALAAGGGSVSSVVAAIATTIASSKSSSTTTKAIVSITSTPSKITVKPSTTSKAPTSSKSTTIKPPSSTTTLVAAVDTGKSSPPSTTATTGFPILSSLAAFSIPSLNITSAPAPTFATLAFTGSSGFVFNPTLGFGCVRVSADAVSTSVAAEEACALETMWVTDIVQSTLWATVPAAVVTVTVSDY